MMKKKKKINNNKNAKNTQKRPLQQHFGDLLSFQIEECWGMENY